MHISEPARISIPLSESRTPWYQELNRYHWFVLIVAALGWLFDTMDQQLFNLARVPAIRELLTTSAGVVPSDRIVAEYAGYATVHGTFNGGTVLFLSPSGAMREYRCVV